MDGCGKLWTSWWPHNAAQKYNRPPFRASFDALINALQREMFRDQAKISGILSGIGVTRMEDERYYVFHIETDDYRYYFRVYHGKATTRIATATRKREKPMIEYDGRMSAACC